MSLDSLLRYVCISPSTETVFLPCQHCGVGLMVTPDYSSFRLRVAVAPFGAAAQTINVIECPRCTRIMVPVRSIGEVAG